MKTGVTTVILSSAAICAAFGQSIQTPGVFYQQAGVIGTQIASGATGGQVTFFSSTSLGGPTVPRKPFSASEEHRSQQVLGDGTHIDRVETSKLYRDDQGRTRTETGPAGAQQITIQDPVGGFIVTLDPATGTVHKLPFPHALAMPFPAGVAQARSFETFDVQTDLKNDTATDGKNQSRPRVIALAGTAIGPGGPAMPPAQPDVLFSRVAKPPRTPASEDLGANIVNGVPAQGTRTTFIIPRGEIGNDRDIRIVSERWFSPDLEMTVKSTDSDPRSGETSYQLTNINRAAQDPSLFQIPAGYTMAPEAQFEYRTLPAPAKP